MKPSKFFSAAIILTTASYYIFFLSFQSCNSKTKSETDNVGANWSKVLNNVEYLELLSNHISRQKEKNDTALLGYVIGWDKKDAEAHTEALINNETISQKALQNFKVYVIRNKSSGSYNINTWTGYGYSFLINPDLRCHGFLNYSFDNGRLSHLCLFITENISIEELRQFLERKFGKPRFKTEVFKDDHIAPYKTYIWLEGGKEIQLGEWESLSYIQYSNIIDRYKIEREAIETTIRSYKNDSVEKADRKKEAEKSPKAF